MATPGEKTSPDVEFGTFLRLPHQSRTFSRPADSYMPSSPPSRPTSPIPASSPSPGVFLHGRPAPVTSKMRQGAPRLGGLGLGGIVESTPAPPPLPARKAISSSSPNDPNRSSVPPPIPAAPLSSSSRSASPASTNGRPHTANSAKLDPKAGYPERPFLSPEMDKPTVREGTFALDRPKFEDVIKRSSDEGVEREETETASTMVTSEAQQPSLKSDEIRETEPNEEKERESISGFPTPQVAEEDNSKLFDHFKSALAPETQAIPPIPAALKREEETVESDRASVNSEGDSLFATPETVAASMEEDEAIPALALDHPPTTMEQEEEEIAFDGPTQLAEKESNDELSSQVDEPVQLDQYSDSAEPSSTMSIRDYSPPRTLAEALVSRADKSSSADGHASTPGSVTTSVYNSRDPSLHEFLREEDDLQPPESDSLDPSSPTSIAHLSASSPSPAPSRSPGLSEDFSPSYTQGNRHLDDPAALYPSPPSSPATSIHASPFPEERGIVPPSEDSSIYSNEAAAKPTPEESRHIEDVAKPVELAEPKLESNDTPIAASAPTFESSQQDFEPAFTPQQTSSEYNTAPIASPPLASPPTSPSLPPSFNSAVSPIPRRSRFSYQGLGLRMPSSIAPKVAPEEHVQAGEGTLSSTLPIPPVAEERSDQSRSTKEKTKATEEVKLEESESSQPTNSLFPWMKYSQGQETSVDNDPSSPPQHSEVVPGYRNDSSYPSSPSAYAPSSTAPSPEISRGPTFAPLMVPVATQAFVSPAPEPQPVESTPPAQIESTIPPSSDVGSSSAIAPVSRSIAAADPAITSSDPALIETRTEETEEEEVPNQLSTVGVAVDIGAAVVGALAMGGFAVGQSAWKGLAVGWSAWRGASNQPVMQEAKVLEVSNIPEEDNGLKSYAKSKEVVEENEGSSRKAESSVISTEWGEAEFEAPEGFLEQLKMAMAEIGEEDLAANEKAQVDAQLAAYHAASQQHVDAVASPTLSDNSSLPPPSPVAVPANRSFRQRESSARRSQPETIAEDSADEDERELEDLLAPVWDSPSRRESRIVEFPTRHGFAPPPGLTGSTRSRPVSVMSNSSSMGSLRSSGTQGPTAPPSPRQQPKLSKTSKSILGFGRSKSTKKLTKPAPPPPRSESLPSISKPRTPQPSKPQPVSSKESKPVDDSHSQHSRSSSHKTSGRRSSIFNFGGGKDVPPVPTIESQIKDMTYISYGSDKSKRRTSNASLPPGLYASRDPFLITPQATPTPISPPNQYRGPPSLTGSSPRTNRSEDLGGAPLGRRKSSLRSGSAFDGSSQLTRSSSIVEGGKKLYRVRFGNAVGGIGLRQVADSEAARAGGDRYGQRWVGVGRGRYGNMIIKTDEESELVYAEQVAQIKKKWRAFGSEQSRDWAAVKID